MVSEMVRHVADAISCEDYGEDQSDYYVRMARAAIEAMREPTEDMDERGQTLCNSAYLEKEDLPADAHFVWTAMIDAALSGSNHDGE